MYHVRRVNIGQTAQLDELAHACGELYSRTLVFFWRTVRHKRKWLKPKHLMGLFTSDKLHAHTSDATVQAFFAALKSWRERHQSDPTAKPPRKRKWYFRVEYKRSAMSLHDGLSRLSNGKGNGPLLLDWPWDLPHAVIIHWAGARYEAIATYHQEEPQTTPQGEQVAGVDLGEFHLAVSHDRELVSELSTSGTSIWTWDQWSGHDTPYGHERCPSRSRSSPRPDGDVPPVVVRSRGVANPRGMSHLCTQAVKT